MGREAFTTESGGLDDYVFTVTDAYFAVVPGYRDGTDWFLHWVGTTDSEGQPIMDRDGYHPSWRLGDGWESVDGGKTVKHPIETKQFNSQGPMGELTDRIAVITDGADPDPLFGDAIDPRYSEWYVGMSFRIVQEDRTYNIDGVERKSRRPLPTEYLGMGEVAAPAAVESVVTEIDKATEARLKVLAKNSATFAEFEKGALDIDGVVDDSALLELVIDDGASGFYAKAQA